MASVLGIDKNTGRYRRLESQPNTMVLEIFALNTNMTIPVATFVNSGLLPKGSVSDTPYTDYPEMDVLEADGTNVTSIMERSWSTAGYTIKGLTPNTAYYLKVSAITGPKGEPGKPGISPVRGVDFWTSDDIESIKQDTHNYIDELILTAKW